MTERNPIQLHIREFTSARVIPLAYPVTTPREDIITVAHTLLTKGKAREARVIDTTTGTELWAATWGTGWQVTTDLLGEQIDVRP